MNVHPMGEPGETMIGAGHQTTVALCHINDELLLHLGTRQVVYLKAGLHDGELAFILRGADGTSLVMIDTIETAVDIAVRRGLDFVAFH